MAIAKPMGNDSSFLGFRNSKLRRKAILKHLNFWSWFGFGASEVPNLLHMFWSVLGEALNVQAKYWRFSVWMPENCFISVCDNVLYVVVPKYDLMWFFSNPHKDFLGQVEHTKSTFFSLQDQIGDLIRDYRPQKSWEQLCMNCVWVRIRFPRLEGFRFHMISLTTRLPKHCFS